MLRNKIDEAWINRNEENLSDERVKEWANTEFGALRDSPERQVLHHWNCSSKDPSSQGWLDFQAHLVLNH